MLQIGRAAAAPEPTEPQASDAHLRLATGVAVHRQLVLREHEVDAVHVHEVLAAGQAVEGHPAIRVCVRPACGALRRRQRREQHARVRAHGGELLLRQVQARLKARGDGAAGRCIDDQSLKLWSDTR